jgi:hypothetical protein
VRYWTGAAAGDIRRVDLDLASARPLRFNRQRSLRRGDLMDPHALLLARIQFGFTISVHIIFPAFSIGSSAFVATLLVLWRRSGRDHYLRIARFWTKIFAVSFAMGVVSGIPLSYELGTNWSRYSLATGNVIGPLIHVPGDHAVRVDAGVPLAARDLGNSGGSGDGDFRFLDPCCQ